MSLQNKQIEQRKLNLPITPRYWLAFLLLTFLCYQAHELFHHFLGAILCDGFGQMTFGVFILKSQCKWENFITLAGPLLTFAIAWLGMYILSLQKHMLFAYTLVFASFAHLRFMLPLGKGGDEWLLARTYFHQPNPYAVSVILFILGLPPILYAFKFISNHKRTIVFATSWLMPFVILIILSFVDNWLFSSNPENIRLAFAGVPFTVLLTDLIAFILFVFIGKQFIT